MKIIILCAVICLFWHLELVAQGKNEPMVKSFEVNQKATIKMHAATGNISFIKFSQQNNLNALAKDRDPVEKAEEFLEKNKELLHIEKQDRFEVASVQTDIFGFDHVTFQQFYEGVPVFDGKIKVHFNARGNVAAYNAVKVTVHKLNARPRLTAEIAADKAKRSVVNLDYIDQEESIQILNNTLMVFQKGLAQGYNGGVYLVYEVEVGNSSTVREFVYVDAETGDIVEQFSGIHPIIDRKLYETSLSASNLRWTEGNALPGALDQWQQSEVATAGHMYYMMKHGFGINSFNGADASMVTINNNPAVACPNATWNGTSANFCTGIATDDVVAHEWGHAYTEHSSNLIYAWQAGALNESYSDIYGEAVDLLNNYMDSGESNAPRNACNSSQRWQIAEKAGVLGGAIRDMWDPTCKADPGKVSDPQYYCDVTDSGGVHTNSGVHNHAFALLVDGGTYNGQTINAIGITKALHIFNRAQVVYQTRTTDFASQANYLEAAAADLLGINLPALSTSETDPGLSGQVITAADVAEVVKTMLAVEMRSSTRCAYTKLLKPVSPECGDQVIFTENFDNGFANWTLTNTGVSPSWVSRNWEITNMASGSHPGNVAKAPNPADGDCITNNQDGLIRLESPEITIPNNDYASAVLNLSFEHFISTEFQWDGGNVKLSKNGGAFELIPASAFTANPYNTTLKSVQLNTNPLAGQAAFSGCDAGSVSGSWGESRINLLAMGVSPGDRIKLRFDFGTDGCDGFDAWYVDNIKIYTCNSAQVSFASTQITVSENEANGASENPNICQKYIEKNIEVKAVGHLTAPVDVSLVPLMQSASGGAIYDDYEFVNGNTVTLDDATPSKMVRVRIYDDKIVETSEQIQFGIAINAHGGNAIVATQNQSQFTTILDNDINPGLIEQTLMFQNFEAGMPANWPIFLANGTSPDPQAGVFPYSWTVSTQAGALDGVGSKFLLASSVAAGNTAWDKIIETAPMDASGYQNIKLSFLEFFRTYNGAGDMVNETASIEAWNGSSWQNILTHTEAGGSLGSLLAPANTVVNLPNSFAVPNLKFRFRYSAQFDWYWLIDNIRVTAEKYKEIQTAVNTSAPAEAYLGPNQNVVFYDPTTGKTIAKIKNLSAHDYGCTSISIDRAGQGFIPWVYGKQISQKTYRIVPTTNNPAGSYELTLYYTAAELAGMQNQNLYLGKSNGNISNSNEGTYSPVSSETAYGSDFAFTSTFDSGFSGFGLSIDQAVALPVKLLSFKGENTLGNNILQWETSIEVNHDYFVVERSTDAKSFVEIGKVQSGSEPGAYQFVDRDLSQGTYYYRLKDVDNSGKIGFSKIIAINVQTKQTQLVVYPNPAVNNLSVKTSDDSYLSQIQLFSTKGQQVMSMQNRGNNADLDISSLPKGEYIIFTSSNKGLLKSKFIKN